MHIFCIFALNVNIVCARCGYSGKLDAVLLACLCVVWRVYVSIALRRSCGCGE